MTENKPYLLIGKMIHTNRMHRRAIESVVDDIGIHRSRHQVLMNLSKRAFSSQKEMAEHLGVTQAAVAVSLSKLERDGLIKRKTGEDGRFNEISITAKGIDIVERSRTHFLEIDSKVFEGCTDEELEAFSRCLDKMQENLKYIYDTEEQK